MVREQTDRLTGSSCQFLRGHLFEELGSMSSAWTELAVSTPRVSAYHCWADMPAIGPLYRYGDWPKYKLGGGLDFSCSRRQIGGRWGGEWLVWWWWWRQGRELEGVYDCTIILLSGPLPSHLKVNNRCSCTHQIYFRASDVCRHCISCKFKFNKQTLHF